MINSHTMEKICGVCEGVTPNFVCHSCMRSLKRDLDLLDWLIAELQVTISRQDKMGSGFRDGGKSDETPLAYGLNAAEARRELLRALRACAIVLNERRSLDYSASILSTLPTWDQGPRHYWAIRKAIARAVDAVDKPAPSRTYVAPCEVADCGGELWTRPGDEAFVECDRCGVVVARTDAADRVDREISGVLFTVTDTALIASNRLGRRVTGDMIHSLTRRKGRPLEPRGRTADGVLLFAPAEVIDRLRKAA